MILTNKKNIDLKTSNTKIFAYGSKTSLPIKGCFYSNIIFHDRIDYATFYEIRGKNKQENLLGIDSTSLGVLKILNSIANEQNVNSNNTRETNSVSNILNKFENIFHGIDKMKYVKVKLATDESVSPIAQKHSRVVSSS